VIAAFSALMELLNAHQFKKEKIAVIANHQCRLRWLYSRSDLTVYWQKIILNIDLFSSMAERQLLTLIRKRNLMKALF
jgi:hypothetical protein